jgi:hypothetical protein
MNVPLCSSVVACRNFPWVFMTIGPYNATGSSRKNHNDARMGVTGAKEILAQRVIHVPLVQQRSQQKTSATTSSRPKSRCCLHEMQSNQRKSQNWTHHRPGTNYGRICGQGSDLASLAYVVCGPNCDEGENK